MRNAIRWSGARIVAVGVVVVLLAAWGSSDGGERRGQPGERTAQDAWIDSVPLLTIGADPNDPLHRVTGAVLVGDTLIIAQASASSLRFYDRHTGEFLQRGGRRGEGPGEYTELSSLRRVGERLYTYDVFSRRVTVYDLSGSGLLSRNGAPRRALWKQWGEFQSRACVRPRKFCRSDGRRILHPRQQGSDDSGFRHGWDSAPRNWTRHAAGAREDLT